MRTAILLTVLIAASADADLVSKRIDSSGVRAMGGVTAAAESMAGAAMENKSLSIIALGIDLRGSLSVGLEAYGWVMDAMDFKDNLSLADMVVQRGKLVDLASRVPRAFDLWGHVDVARFQFGSKRLGAFMVGAYAEGLAGVRLDLPDPDSIRVVGQEIDIGGPVTMVETAGLGDVGGTLGYGRVFGLPKGLSLAAGAQVRIFHRWLVRSYRVTAAARISEAGGIDVPDFSHETGVGGTTSLSSILMLGDRFVDARVGLEVGGIGAVSYANGMERETANFAVGAVVRPLASIGFRRLEVGTELRAEEGGNPSWHIGSSIAWGGRWLSFSPRIGGIIMDRRMFGEARNVFTGGFTATLGIVHLAGVVELYDGGYITDLTLGLGN